jgi:hypothetical protein
VPDGVANQGTDGHVNNSAGVTSTTALAATYGQSSTATPANAQTAVNLQIAAAVRANGSVFKS